MKEKIVHSLSESSDAIEYLKRPSSLSFIEQSAQMLAQCYNKGGKVLLAGNGGSLCDAMHFAEELTGFFREKRPALSAIALSDPGHLTCVGNDVGFETVFSRAVEAHGKRGDIFVGMSTSGNSSNILNAFSTAKQRGLLTIAFLGKEGGAALDLADLQLVVPGRYSDRIQEAHMTAIHIIIECVEQLLFSAPTSLVEEFVNSSAER